MGLQMRIRLFAGLVAVVIAWGLQFAALSNVFAAETPAPMTFSVPLEARNGSAITGSVTLSPQGSGTLIEVSIFALPAFQPNLTLYSGTDCLESATAASRPIPLNPVSSGQTSQTIVAIPLTAFKSQHFVLDVRDATSREQVARACARLGP